MCGRFTLPVDAHQIREAFPWITVPDEIQPRFNIAPSQPVAVIPNDGENRLDFFVWGLIPSWAKDPAIGNRMINARGETVEEKPSFRAAFKRRRCLVLADGFYEWKRERTTKQPYYFRMKDHRPFAFAGLWERWEKEDPAIESCCLITIGPNAVMEPIHHRMPVILPMTQCAEWLDASLHETERLNRLLRPFPSEKMEAYPVSPLVNNPRHDTPECVETMP